MFGVFHKYDVDGGFGDAVSERDLICVFKTAEEANDFVEKYEKPACLRPLKKLMTLLKSMKSHTSMTCRIVNYIAGR